MQKKLFHKAVLFIALVVTPLIFISCISGTQNKIPSQLQLGFKINNLDSTVTSGQDSIHVESVRVILGESFIETDEEDSLLFVTQPVMIKFDSQGPQYANPLSLGSGTFPSGVYQKLAIKLTRAPEDNAQIDDDFIDGDNRYSLIAKGTYHDEPFTFKTQQKAQPTLSFSPPLSVASENEAYTFILDTDVETWFSKGAGQGIYDPTVEENATAININISNSFSYEQRQQ